MNSAGACPASQSAVREARLRSGRQLFLDTAHHNASDDVLRQEQINQDNRENRERDHRINLTLYNLAAIMDGEIQNIIDQLIIAENAERLKESEL